MTTERAIHVLIFVLLLFGLWIVSTWVSYTYLINENLILAIAGVPLSWGIILLLLYVAFKRLDWKWWS